MADAVSDGDNDEEPERPTVMFVPGGAFISDFEEIRSLGHHMGVHESSAVAPAPRVFAIKSVYTSSDASDEV
eukprot:3704659-Pleurochrysis_carterae.AAC.1